MYHQVKLMRTLLVLTFGMSLRISLCHPTVDAVHNLEGNVLPNVGKAFLKTPALEETIDEVQRILHQDLTLPRLTRGEIEELYEKVTREELEKSLKAGDTKRAESMRALMLVLPYNTDNNTEENLQELFTRPPVTKVVESNTSHRPIQFITPSPNSEMKSDSADIGILQPTTYKPSFSLKMLPPAPSATTYHPYTPPSVLYRHKIALTDSDVKPFKPINADITPMHENAETFQNSKTIQRFSSHYNAQNADFLKFNSPKRNQPQIPTLAIKPVADILGDLGIFSETRLGSDEYYSAESAPKPIYSTYVPEMANAANLKDAGSQSLTAKIKPDAYAMFKPLNIGEEIRVKPEVEDYLTRFGIVRARKRKEIDKLNTRVNGTNNEEPFSEESEIATRKVPSAHVKGRKDVKLPGNLQLEKLLENLKELERLRAKPKGTLNVESTTTATKIAAQSTTDPTILVTNEKPKLIEAKKPRRRIDPNIDINFGSTSNHQGDETNNSDQLSKLLENLQELQRLQIKPQNVLRNMGPLNKTVRASATRPTVAVTSAPITKQTIIDRFNEPVLSSEQQLLLAQQQSRKSASQPDLQQLQRLLLQIQNQEKAERRTSTTSTTSTTTTTTTTTTKKPLISHSSPLIPNDVGQLRKLLTNDQELERLFEQAKARERERQQLQQNLKKINTIITTTTTKKPKSLSAKDLADLQRYIAEFERPSNKVNAITTSKPTVFQVETTTPRTTTTTPISTITATQMPLRISIHSTEEPELPARKETIDEKQFEALINRVQQVEQRLNNQKLKFQKPLPTDTPLPQLLGFTTRNVKDSFEAAAELNLPVNDFANLRTLYKQVQEAGNRAYHSDVEISTAATSAKILQHESTTSKSQNFAQKIIDITNDTGTGSNLSEPDPREFVQLQKLLSKIQELERVRINTPTLNPISRSKTQREVTTAPSFAAAASRRNENVQRPNGVHLVYPIKEIMHEKSENVQTTDPTTPSLSSQENKVELRENMEENEREKDEIPLVHKTVAKEPSNVVATTSTKQLFKGTQEEMDSGREVEGAEAKKPLSDMRINTQTQELQNAYEEVPKDLTGKLRSKPDDNHIRNTELDFQPIEGVINPNKLDDNNEEPTVTTPRTGSDSDDPTGKTAVFSLTTMKSLTRRPTISTTESSVQLPVFSATKIIEDAILRAVNKIGVSTELPHSFIDNIKRKDNDIDDLIMFGKSGNEDVGMDDLVVESSEISSRMALPEFSPNDAINQDKNRKSDSFTDLTENVPELKRLIKNLKELQKLNISTKESSQHTHKSTPALTQTDYQYFENLKEMQPSLKIENKVTAKSRRQSPTTSTESSKSNGNTPIRIALTTNTQSVETERPRNDSLAVLEESFGPNPIAEEPPPPRKKNGFYFLADWNSFLEVGDGDDQVVVRLSPKIGDPRLFLPVKIP
uniref:Uncharacterized protein n=1 Tax=Glossina pallidipes TaxID=7398 RepID=A0A1A9ZER1_GLOPL